MLHRLLRLLIGPVYNPGKTSFENCINFTKFEEGGYSSNSADRGNWTSGVAGKGELIGSKYGLSAPVIVEHLGYIPSANYVKNIDGSFFAIVAGSFWDKCGANTLAKGVDLMVFDYGWNRGVSATMSCLQKVVGAKVDGVYGPDTIACVKKYIAQKGSVALIYALTDEQIAEYKALADFPTFGKGWINRTYARQKFSLTMVS